MRPLVLACLVLCVMCQCFGQQCPEYPEPVPIDFSTSTLISQAFTKLDQYLQKQVSGMQIPSLVATVVYDQDIVWSKGYGQRDPWKRNSGPPDLDSVVRIASISKVFTDLMLFKLRDEGQVSLDDYVDKYMTNFKIKVPYNTKRKITLRELASHTSGLPREVPCNWDKFAECTEQDILRNLSRQYLIFPQYYRPHYSNLGLALLGRTLEKVVGVKFEDYMVQNIFEPLRMNSSNYSPTKDMLSRLAVGVTTLENGTVMPAPLEDLAWGNPMGGVFSTSRDMSQLMSMMFRPNQDAGDNQIVDGATILQMLTPNMVTRDGMTAFGFPWEFQYDPTNGVWLRAKAGELVGYRSQVSLVPEIKMGIFICAMADVDDSTQSIFTQPSMDILLPAFMQTLWSIQPNPPLPPNYTAFVGLYTYTSSFPELYGVSWQVYKKNNKLYGSEVINGQPIASTEVVMSQFDETTWRIKLVQDAACRWMDDGMHNELIYFTLSSDKQYATTAVVMGITYSFQSHNCPSC